MTDVVMIGTGRSGTTIAAQLMGAHPDLAWFSSASSRFPATPIVAIASRVTAIAPHAEVRGWPRPSEAISVWDHYFPGFYAAARDLGASDVADGDVDGFRKAVRGHCRWQGRPHFFTKITGWPRVQFVRAALPGCRIVHVERDPRAVAASMMKLGWGGLRSHPERFAQVDLPSFYASMYLRFYQARADHDWSDVEVLRYEDLAADPVAEILRLCDRLTIGTPAPLARRLSRFEVYPARPWDASLDRATAARLDDLLALPVHELGYCSHP